MKGVSSTRGPRVVFLRLLPTITLTALFVASTLLTSHVASAATFDVNTTLDAVDCNPGDGVAETDPGNGQCSLRAAIMETNALPGADSINLPQGTYTLSIPPADFNGCEAGDLNIEDDLTIVGGGQDVTIIDGNRIDRVLDAGWRIFREVAVTIESLTVTHGETEYDGGGLFVFGTTTLSHCTFRENSGLRGGGAFNGGTIQLTECRFQDNEATYSGAGLFNGVKATLDDCTFTGNVAGISGGAVYTCENVDLTDCVFAVNAAERGAGISNTATVTLTRCTFSGNAATTCGGGLSSDGSATLTACVFTANQAPTCGGGMTNSGDVTLDACSFSENCTEGSGGGISSDFGMMALTDCVVSRNTAGSGGGVSLLFGTTTLVGCKLVENIAEYGGGLETDKGTLKLEACTFSKNEASAEGGGFHNSGTSTLYGCTLSENRSLNGGGIWNDGTANLANCTLSGNEAGDDGEGVYTRNALVVINCTIAEDVSNTNEDSLRDGWGIYIDSGNAKIGNTIIWRNDDCMSGVDWPCHGISGDFVSLGPNLFDSCFWPSEFRRALNAGKNDWGEDWPILEPLADNGGPTQTHALLPRSWVVDMGDNTLVTNPPFGEPLSYDQRGEPFARIGDADKDGTATVDIGAFEVQNSNAPVAVDDTYIVDEGATLEVAAPGLLANDFDGDGDTLMIRSITRPEHGEIQCKTDGSFIYVHDGGESTSDTFTYVMDDGFAPSNTATVTITVRPVNDPPVAQGKTYAVDEGRILAVAAPGILSRCIDPDPEPLSAHLLTSTLHGALTLNADGSFVYVHDGSETTQDTFTFEARDASTASNPATVTIIIHPVYDMPDAEDDAYEVEEGGILDVAAPGLLANDTGQEGSPLTTVTPTQPSHGALTLKPDGSFTYTHDGSDSTTDSFRYVLRDASSFCDVATVSITVHPLNDWDVNRDDAVDALDLQLVINRVIGIAADGDADVNDDGRSDAIDVQLLINALIGA